MYYFAFGSNMEERHLQERVPSARRLCIARADEYRLVFSRRSVRSGGGVADLKHAPGFATYGVLFEVDDDQLVDLDRAEGLKMHPPAYRRTTISVRPMDKREVVESLAYQVRSPAPIEIAPRATYIDAMIQAFTDALASYHDDLASIGEKRAETYLVFLRWLKELSGDLQGNEEGTAELARPGLLVAQTDASRGNSSEPVVQLHSTSAASLGKSAILSSSKFSAFAELVVSDSVARDVIAVDQTLRVALELGGQLVFGHTAALTPGPSIKGLFSARSLTLRLSQARVADVERNLCVLHHRSLEALGLRAGEYVDVLRPEGTNGSEGVRRITLRCVAAGMVGTGDSYPGEDRVYLDQQGRDRLGIAREVPHLGMPLLLRPNIRHAVQARLAIYGITILLGISAFTDIVSRLTHWGDVPVALAALSVAAVLTLGLAFVDLRNRVKP